MDRSSDSEESTPSPSGNVENSEQQGKANTNVKEKQGGTVDDCDTIPENVYKPSDLTVTITAVRNLKQHNSILVHELADATNRQSEERQIEKLLVLVTKCHNSLRLRTSNVFLLCALMRKMLQRVDPYEPEMFKLMCALIHLVHKYEPTDEKTVMQADELFQSEALVFERLGYNLIVVTPYDYIYVFAECGQLSKQQICLAMYLCSLVSVSINGQKYDACKVAAAIILLVLEAKNQSWNASLSFWSGHKPTQLVEERQMVQMLWMDSFQNAKNGKQGFVYKKFMDARNYQVSLEEPVVE